MGSNPTLSASHLKPVFPGVWHGQILLGRTGESLTDCSRLVVAGGSRSQASAANHEFTLEPHLVGLIRCLLLFPSVLRLSLASLLGRCSVQRADDDFSLRPGMRLWPRLNRRCIVRRRRAESVPCDGRSGLRCTTISQRATTREHQRGNKQNNAFRNHRDHFKAWQSKTEVSARPGWGTIIQLILKNRATQG